MTLAEITSAVDRGETVHWGNEGYRVIRDRLGRYRIKCDHDGHCIGLTWLDGVTLNGKPDEFFISDKGK
jgi:hypothetical protein